MGNGKLESPQHFGNGGKNTPTGPQPKDGKLVSPAQTSKGGETKNHDNGNKS